MGTMGGTPSTTTRTVVWLCFWFALFCSSMIFRGAQGLTILWDTSKGVANSTYDPQYGPFFSDLRNYFRGTRGYTLVFHDNSNISLTNYPLQMFDVFMSGSIMVSVGDYLVAEQNRLASFVQKGGGALLQFESPSSELNNSNIKVNQLLQTITQGTEGLYLPEQVVLPSGLLGLVLFSNPLLQGIQATDLFSFSGGSRLNLFNTTSKQVSAAYSYTLNVLGVPAYVAVEMCPNGCLAFASCDTYSLTLVNQSGGANYKLIHNLWNWFEDGIQIISNNTDRLVLNAVTVVDSVHTINFAVQLFGALPNYNITLTVDGQVEDSVSGGFLNLTEITSSGQVVRTVDFSNFTYSITNGTGAYSNSSIRFSGKALTGEIVEFEFEVIDQPTVAQFVTDVFYIPQDSLKWTFLCTGWNFSSTSNSLVANFFLGSTQNPFLALSQTTNQNNTGVIYNLTASETVLSVQLLNRALVDDNLVPIQHSILGFESPSTRVIVQLTFPYFASSVIYDPDYSVLLGNSTSSSGGGTDILLIVLTSVLVPLAVFAVLSVGIGLAVTAYVKRHHFLPSIAERDTVNL